MSVPVSVIANPCRAASKRKDHFKGVSRCALFVFSVRKTNRNDPELNRSILAARNTWT